MRLRTEKFLLLICISPTSIECCASRRASDAPARLRLIVPVKASSGGIGHVPQADQSRFPTLAIAASVDGFTCGAHPRARRSNSRKEIGAALLDTHVEAKMATAKGKAAFNIS